ncbi:peroxiredoxin (alkyl hydroperoxide reductase subunit C) [Hypnocyclicus thermotrophus]|uniref:Alkyl hydroperoxide reductase C n=1 Tax=Hypnocyclicus thermotrophus TaxID=1627895 RepID=A0AA46I6F8_9FUSO|nr:alkyl hydroperoxide reductase subunit C [Hypnocyclicus thermotrophus]TDT72356.1 peroxiredoxin (alkyl hydroperoxide reductase subunit C) [Hypnocyclicus thermotrophus]
MAVIGRNLNDFYYDIIEGNEIVEKKLVDTVFNVFHEGEFKEIKLSDYKGKWTVLFFYPADFTFVCPTELGDMADNYDKFKELKAEVISVSTDTHFVHFAWHNESPTINKIKFPMLGDPTGTLSRAMEVYKEDEGLAYRGTIIINPEGDIVVSEVNDMPIGRNAKEILRKLEAAKYVAEHNGEVCPANWEKGKDTLKPGKDLVGKI